MRRMNHQSSIRQANNLFTYICTKRLKTNKNIHDTVRIMRSNIIDIPDTQIYAKHYILSNCQKQKTCHLRVNVKRPRQLTLTGIRWSWIFYITSHFESQMLFEAIIVLWCLMYYVLWRLQDCFKNISKETESQLYLKLVRMLRKEMLHVNTFLNRPPEFLK